jgi:hypothetical protein
LLKLRSNPFAGEVGGVIAIDDHPILPCSASLRLYESRDPGMVSASRCPAILLVSQY